MYISRDIKEYYSHRANEYEKVYSLPSRKESVQWLKALLQKLFKGKCVLEISCGTGYWTQVIADVAESVFATDINESVIKIAMTKKYPRENVRFQVADAFLLDNVTGSFNAGFAGFLWSHISKDRLRDLLVKFHSKLQPNSIILFSDNNRVGDLLGKESDYIDSIGNRYSIRILQNGEQYEIIKNFPTEADIREVIKGLGSDVQCFSSTYYWCVSYFNKL